jgi:hypothetical protein
MPDFKGTPEGVPFSFGRQNENRTDPVDEFDADFQPGAVPVKMQPC